MLMSKKKMARWRVLAQVLMVSPGVAAYAAGAPDAGAVQQQIEQTLKQPARPAGSTSAVPAAEPRREGQLQVQVRAFEFVGNQRVDTAALAAATRPFTGQLLDMNGLQRAVDAVRQVYREAGWMAHVFLPAQEVDVGRIRIEIVEAVLGQTMVLGQSTHIAPQVIRGVLSAQLTPAQPIHNARLERALMLLSDLPGVASSSSFARGAQPGQTDLLVTVEDKANTSGSVGVDNLGSSATGRARVLATLNVANPAQAGDLATLAVLKSEGTEYGRASYTRPVGADGWRVGGYAARMNYQTMGLGSQFSGHGDASTYGLNVTYPVLRSQARNVLLSSAIEEKSFQNQDTLSAGSDYRIRLANLSISVNGQDGWLGGGLSTAVLGVTNGQVRPNTQLMDPSTEGQYTKWALSVSRLQAISASLTANVLLNVQRSGKNLDSSEKMYFGGAYGVRAYPTSEGSAREGESLSLELSQRLGQGVSVSGFYDHGRGRNPASTEEALRHFSIRGWGASVSWQVNAQTQFKAIAAQRIGSNPLPGSTLGAHRLWLSANYAF